MEKLTLEQYLGKQIRDCHEYLHPECSGKFYLLYKGQTVCPHCWPLWRAKNHKESVATTPDKTSVPERREPEEKEPTMWRLTPRERDCLQALINHDGNRALAAKVLGITKHTIYNHLSACCQKAKLADGPFCLQLEQTMAWAIKNGEATPKLEVSGQ